MITVNGMTLRDYIAIHVLQGICASPPSDYWTNELLSKEAYDIADSMLEERKK